MRRRNWTDGRNAEHNAQAALFQWAAARAATWPELRLMFAIPNGGRRDAVTGARLKAEGVKAGVPDIFLPVVRRGKHGLFIEMKAGGAGRVKTYPTQPQLRWLALLNEAGYMAAICRGLQEAIQTIEAYLHL